MKKKYRWSLRKKLNAVLLVLVLGSASIIGISTKQTTDPAPAVTEAEEFKPTPLVVETDEPGTAGPQGVYYGTIVFSGPGIEGGSYEGLMFVEMDGEYIRITCTDAVRSQFGDVF